MGPLSDDQSLLARYVGKRDETAFAALVRRHVNLVYSAAARRVGDRDLAQDVTQAVFVIMAKKAKSIRGDAPLSTWLLTTVRYAAANALKIEMRRRRHERMFAEQQIATGACSSNPTDVLLWQEIAEQLDDAVLKLSAADRRAVLLRYFENRSIADIAADLDITQSAAKQRLSRALDKLRQRLGRRGVGVETIASSEVAMLLATHAVRAAPAGLVEASFSIASGGRTGSGISIAKGAIKMMTFTKMKLAAMITAVAIVGGGGVLTIQHVLAQETRTNPSAVALAQQQNDQGGGPTIASMPPSVVSTSPQAGAVDVDPDTTEIKVTFSKQMHDHSWSWVQISDQSFPKMAGATHYLQDHRTCVLPVKLEAGKTYVVWLNDPHFDNFIDLQGLHAVPYLLVFQTAK
jgi:RNA polymerase sigma factor (sigma-70 family)